MNSASAKSLTGPAPRVLAWTDSEADDRLVDATTLLFWSNLISLTLDEGALTLNVKRVDKSPCDELAFSETFLLLIVDNYISGPHPGRCDWRIVIADYVNVMIAVAQS